NRRSGSGRAIAEPTRFEHEPPRAASPAQRAPRAASRDDECRTGCVRSTTGYTARICFAPARPLARKLSMTDSRQMLASMAPDELRSAMRSLGYRTQNDLAQAIGVSRSAVSLWLEGKVGVPRPVAMLLRMLVNAQRRVYLPPRCC